MVARKNVIHVGSVPIIESTSYLEQRPHVDVIAKIRESAGDHFPATVMSILTHFGYLN